MADLASRPVVRSVGREAGPLQAPPGSLPGGRALGTAATDGRFAEGDLLSVLDHQGEHDGAEPIRRSETRSLQPGTSAWSGFGST